jgi:hypothetical protein
MQTMGNGHTEIDGRDNQQASAHSSDDSGSRTSPNFQFDFSHRKTQLLMYERLQIAENSGHQRRCRLLRKVVRPD